MRLHTRTGTFKHAPAWVFFKTCNFTHLNAVLPEVCVCVCVFPSDTKCVIFTHQNRKLDFMTSHGRLNFLSLVANLPIRASIPVKEANEANGKTTECVWMGRPHLSRLRSAGDVKTTARIREVKRSRTHTPLLTALSYFTLDVIPHLKSLASLLAPVSTKK